MPFSTAQTLNPDYSMLPRTRIYRFQRNSGPLMMSDSPEEVTASLGQYDEVNVPEGWSEADAYELCLSENPSTDPEEQEYRNRRLSELRERDDGELRQFLRVATGSGDPSEIITRERENQMVALLHRARQEGREGTKYVILLSDYINRHRPDNPTEDGLQRQLLSILRQHQMRSQINESSMNIQRAMERQRMSTASGVYSPSIFDSDQRERSVGDWRGGINALLKRDKVKPVQDYYLFGLEFEAYKPDGTKLQFIKTQFGTDGSLAPPKNHSGFEFRMEPMKFDSAHQHVRRLLPYIRNKGCDVNASCGFHTHISHDIFFDSKFIKRLVFFWISIEDVIMSTQPDSRSNNFYCKRTLFQYINDVGKNLPSAKDDLIYAMGDTDRYSALNLTALQKHGTIEIRLHAGTLDEDKIINWTILLKHIFDYVKDEYKPQTAHSIFNQDISDEKIQRVFKLLKLPEETAKFYTERIQKFGWKRLREQNIMAKECIIMQKARIKASRELIKLERSFQDKVKKIRGEIRQYRNEGSSHTSEQELCETVRVRRWADAPSITRNVLGDDDRAVRQMTQEDDGYERRGAGVMDRPMEFRRYAGGGGGGEGTTIPAPRAMTGLHDLITTNVMETATAAQWNGNHEGDEGAWGASEAGSVHSVTPALNSYFNQSLTGANLTQDSLARAVRDTYTTNASTMISPSQDVYLFGSLSSPNSSTNLTGMGA